MERSIDANEFQRFLEITAAKFNYVHDNNYYCESLSSDVELLHIFRNYYREYVKREPWSSILKKTFLDKKPPEVFNQKVFCDGTFLREENAMFRSFTSRTNYKGYIGPFYQCELLILYLAGVDRMQKLQRVDELHIVVKFLDSNRRSFRGQTRDGHTDIGRNRKLTTQEQYDVYYKPILDRIRDLIKRKGTSRFNN